MTFLFKSLVAALCLSTTAGARRSMREIQLHKQLEVFDRTGGGGGGRINTSPAALQSTEVYWMDVSVRVPAECEKACVRVLIGWRIAADRSLREVSGKLQQSVLGHGRVLRTRWAGFQYVAERSHRRG